MSMLVISSTQNWACAHVEYFPIWRSSNCEVEHTFCSLPLSLTSSQLGQRGGFFHERLDLMIDGRSKSDLELYRTALVEKGLTVDEIAEDQFFGHDYFQLTDPDSNGITVYTSHVGELPV
jgi:hypothetical protein